MVQSMVQYQTGLKIRTPAQRYKTHVKAIMEQRNEREMEKLKDDAKIIILFLIL